MATGDGFTSRLLVGLAQHLHAAGVATYRATGAYQTNEIGIFFRKIPQSPDRFVSLAEYPLGTTLQGMADHLTGVQIRLRGTTDPRVCDDLADAIFDELDGLTGARWGEIPIVQMWRQSYTPLGEDGNGRWERSENFYVHAMRPTSNNTD
ncbi:minor capsid protein [Catellatospora coxensis]|uniref:Uncharacterized protein n=1 Tax=Catellatospora coxensis TaxID=310354 RepID=A0A8J3L2L8_9ACTN|nr:minor capsid protein [Catellatospora coxensis]GIG10214.1 hypothetical protein Cco03nite_69140 [Catellatospora coxensis]